MQKHNARLVKAANVPTVFLDASVEELWRRCRKQSDDEGSERPLLTSLTSFRDLYDARRPHYSKAFLRLETGGKTIDEIAAEVVATLGLQPSQQSRAGLGQRGSEQGRQRKRGEKL